jgi:flagellar biogenesis protein FliO
LFGVPPLVGSVRGTERLSVSPNDLKAELRTKRHASLLSFSRFAELEWRLSLAVAFVLLPTNAFAQLTNATSLTSPSPLPDVGVSLLRVAGAMAVVLGLFFAGVWCFRNWQRLTVRRHGASALQILEVKGLANRQALYLVSCDNERLLIGASAAGLNTLCHLPAAKACETVSPDSSDTELCAVSPPGSFSRTLQAVLGRKS